MKYRKKPVVIEAIQYNGEQILFNCPEWLADAQRKGIIFFKKFGREFSVTCIRDESPFLALFV